MKSRWKRKTRRKSTKSLLMKRRRAQVGQVLALEAQAAQVVQLAFTSGSSSASGYCGVLRQTKRIRLGLRVAVQHRPATS
jgi:hypothetical protein